MNEQHDIRSRNEVQFLKIALRVLKQAGFKDYIPEKKPFLSTQPQGLLKKDGHIYCLETFFSRRELYTSRAILNTAEYLVRHAKEHDYLPLIVVGGVLPPVLRGDLLGKSLDIVILDIENLLYIAQKNQNLYDELVAQLSYSPEGLNLRESSYLPMREGKWQIPKTQDRALTDDRPISVPPRLPVAFVVDTSASMIGCSFNPLILTNAITGETKTFTKAEVKVGRDPANDYHIAGKMQVGRQHATFCFENQRWFLIDDHSKNGTFLNGQRLTAGEKYQLSSNDKISFAKQEVVVFDNQAHYEMPEIDPGLKRAGESEHTDKWNGRNTLPALPGMIPEPSGERVEQNFNGQIIIGNPGTGKSSLITRVDSEQMQKECEALRKEIKGWISGKETNSTTYEQLCTRTLKRVLGDDLTLWKVQAKSNDSLFRFDLICKIKLDNHKDFWEMAERYFGSKYIIFEFKNYTEEVTQREVYTTVRYLYTKAMRGIAIIISPNGMDDNGGKACRGVLRDEGKLILSLTNDDLLEMLRMKEDGEDPADFLSDKLDELLIDLEK